MKTLGIDLIVTNMKFVQKYRQSSPDSIDPWIPIFGKTWLNYEIFKFLQIILFNMLI